MVLAVLLISEFEKLWSLEDAHSKSEKRCNQILSHNFTDTRRTPAATPIQLTEPFWIPWLPQPFVT